MKDFQKLLHEMLAEAFAKKQCTLLNNLTFEYYLFWKRTRIYEHSAFSFTDLTRVAIILYDLDECYISTRFSDRFIIRSTVVSYRTTLMRYSV